MKPGARVVNEAEPTLGLGRVERLVPPRSIEVAFPAVGETRLYNLKTAPLRRLVLQPGQQAVGRDGRRFRVERVEEQDGLLIYRGQGRTLAEAELADQNTSTSAADDLRHGRLSHYQLFDLRERGWRVRRDLLASQARGLAGARVRLLPHQLHIAYTVSRRLLPRVLLADEVGLGKTIEAGLIFSALRALGRADRVLILTPPSLLYQWLTELVRRFNELFSVLDFERYEELLEVEDGLTPFERLPRIIAPITLLSDEEALEEAVSASWDLVIVDEAHHLLEGYTEALRQLSRRTRGLLLLTATPMRQGWQTEYALLHLVDPERFGSPEAFEEEHLHLQEVARAARDLDPKRLKELFPEDRSLAQLLDEEAPREEILQSLIDRHGTGRVLVRNRRERLQGFPGRRVHPVPVEDRLNWLFDFVRAHDKTVLIARDAQTVLELQRAFREETGILTATFHEGLSILERDRQVAYFAQGDGAQILLSSEIGGEGRNFQFAHHLVLWDLPLSPDLLEQRIGRLDRIGQDREIQVYVPFAPDSPEEILFRWHHEGLDGFEHPVNGSELVREEVQDELEDVLTSHQGLEKLLKRTRQALEAHKKALQDSVDVLVDLNSFDPVLGEQLVLRVSEQEASIALRDFLSRALESFGVQEEELAEKGLLRIKAGDLMTVDSFPGLGHDRAFLATWDRDLALVREDVEFLSADHPLVEGSLAMALDQDQGRASAALWNGAPEKGVLVQMLYLMQGIGPAELELARYLPLEPLSIHLDARGRDRADLVPPEHSMVGVGAEGAASLVAVLEPHLANWLARAEQLAAERAAPMKAAALSSARETLDSELDRLEELARVNPTVRPAELEGQRQRREQILEALEESRPTLEAIRVIVLR